MTTMKMEKFCDLERYYKMSFLEMEKERSQRARGNVLLRTCVKHDD